MIEGFYQDLFVVLMFMGGLIGAYMIINIIVDGLLGEDDEPDNYIDDEETRKKA